MLGTPRRIGSTSSLPECALRRLTPEELTHENNDRDGHENYGRYGGEDEHIDTIASTLGDAPLRAE